MEFISVGYGNVVNINRVIAVAAASTAPSKRLISEAKESGRCIDVTQGRRTKAVLIMDSDHVVLSALHVGTVLVRLEAASKGIEDAFLDDDLGLYDDEDDFDDDFED
ncbi:MAG: DUF370 domain-containing protein [Clostridia bacterium]|nr:DUF370 domain-containing protein [Clostridia bacterium]